MLPLINEKYHKHHRACERARDLASSFGQETSVRFDDGGWLVEWAFDVDNPSIRNTFSIDRDIADECEADSWYEKRLADYQWNEVEKPILDEFYGGQDGWDKSNEDGWFYEY